MLSASLMPLFGGEVWTFLFMEYWNSHSQAWKRACTERSRWCCCGKRERGKILIIWFNSYVDWKTSIQMFIKIFLFRQEIERSRKGRVAAEALALAGCERGLNWTNIWILHFYNFSQKQIFVQIFVTTYSHYHNDFVL